MLIRLVPRFISHTIKGNATRSRSTAAAVAPQTQKIVCTKAVEEKQEVDQHLYYVPVNVCASLYQQWHQSNINKKKPLQGIDFNVGYFDTMPNAPPQTPTIVALHGSAGSHQHYSFITPYLTRTGARLIIPNFPGSNYTRVDEARKFSHRDQERASFVSDFLKTIGVNRVDVLVAHSSAMFPALRLVKSHNMFRSLAMLNPAGHRPIRVMKPVWFYQILITFVDIPWVRKFIYTMKPIFFREAPNFKVADEKMEETAKSVLFIDFKMIIKLLEEIRDQGLPTVMAYSKNDVVVGMKIFNELINLMNYSVENIYQYDIDEKLIKNGNLLVNNRYAHTICFENGGHFTMKAHPEIIGKAITDLLDYVMAENSI